MSDDTKHIGPDWDIEAMDRNLTPGEWELWHRAKKRPSGDLIAWGCLNLLEEVAILRGRTNDNSSGNDS